MESQFDAEIQIIGRSKDGHSLVVSSMLIEGDSAEFLEPMGFAESVHALTGSKTVPVDLDEFTGDSEFVYYEGVESHGDSCNKAAHLISFEPLDISKEQLKALGR
jgi:hypothetical protein